MDTIHCCGSIAHVVEICASGGTQVSGREPLGVRREAGGLGFEGVYGLVADLAEEEGPLPLLLAVVP